MTLQAAKTGAIDQAGAAARSGVLKIYPQAPGMFDRALPIEGLNLQAITPFAIELHDIIITKLGRYHAKDRSDIELLTRIPGFRHERLTELYALARDDMASYWPDLKRPTETSTSCAPSFLVFRPRIGETTTLDEAKDQFPRSESA